MRVDLTMLESLPPGWASDVEVLARTGSTVEDHGDHLLVCTATNPGYHWGNLLVVRDPQRRDDAADWSSRFVGAFPAASHRSIGLPAAPDPAVWAAAGLRVESDEVLLADDPPRARRPVEGYRVQRLATQADWEAAAALEIAEEPEAGSPSGTSSRAYTTFVWRRWQSRSAASEAGEAAFFAAYRGADQVAHLGIVRCSDHARFQSVLTHRDHRGRGLAGHLLEVAGAWAAGQGASRWVILVEPGSAAGRLYRSVGFQFETLTWQASAQ